jgi:hypothetical protein
VRGIAPDATYQFKHALIRDTAYEALLKTRRRDLHRMVAQTITDGFTELAKTHPEVLARHWTEAGETEQAIAAWLSGGTSAEFRNAFKEAPGSYRQALTLLEALPESAERNNRELELSQSVVSMLYVTKGYTAPETVEATEGLPSWHRKYRIELAQGVIGRNVVFKLDLIKQLLWCMLPSHHRPFLHCAATLIAKPHKLVKDSY